MPGSIAENESPKILIYVGSVGCLVFSLMMTAFGYTNNAWIVLNRPRENDEFQRGVRGLDCYKSNHPENITCLPWKHPYKPDKFPSSFHQVTDASYMVYIAYYIAIFIIASQIFWLAYTVGHCCSLKFCKSIERFKLIMFHISCMSVGLWIILFGMYVYETYTDKVLPRYLMETGFSYSIGQGCWIFFVGGMVPFMGAIYCLFGDEIQQSQDRLREIINNRRLRVPTNEPIVGREITIPMTETRR